MQGTLFELPPDGDPGSVALAELLDAYELVDVTDDDVVIMAEKGQQFAEASQSLGEIGYSSPSPWTAWTREEHNPKLRDKLGTTEYYRMKRIDGIIRGTLRTFKTPVLSAHWFMKPGSESVRDKNVAKWVQENLQDRMTTSWSRTLEDILLMCEYGWMPMEKVYQLDPDGKVSLRKLAPRHPSDIQEMVYDRHGGPAGIIMEPQTFAAQINTTAPSTPYDEGTISPNSIAIPIERLAIFSLEPEAGDLKGISVLRSAYMHYQYKNTLYKIDAIQKERHGIGVPVIKMPPGWKKADKDLAEKIGRNLRTNERSHITLPPMWEIYFAKLEGQPVDSLPSIEHHNEMIMVNVLAKFLTDSGVKKESLETFYKGTRYVADSVADTMNRYVIRPLVEINYSRVKPPSIKVRRIGEWEDARTQSFTLRNYVGAGLLTPDDTIEKHLREENDLPEIDFETRRFPVAPQDPTDEGTDDDVKKPEPSPATPPRQSKPNPGTPSSNGGRDKSGGK